MLRCDNKTTKIKKTSRDVILEAKKYKKRGLCPKMTTHHPLPDLTLVKILVIRHWLLVSNPALLAYRQKSGQSDWPKPLWMFSVSPAYHQPLSCFVTQHLCTTRPWPVQFRAAHWRHRNQQQTCRRSWSYAIRFMVTGARKEYARHVRMRSGSVKDSLTWRSQLKFSSGNHLEKLKLITQLLVGFADRNGR